MDPLRLMAVLAHPDDESLGFGGTLARYAAEGVETYVVTATLGQKGRFRGEPPGPGHPGPARMADIREAELRSAARTLGVRELTLLGYMDGELDRADSREAVDRIARRLRRVQPQVVVTFAPDGGYGHPDHIAICQFATAATVAAADVTRAMDDGDPPHAVSKLYYRGFAAPEWEAYQAAFKRLTAVVDGVEREATPWPPWAFSAVVDTRDHWTTVWSAVSCHESQIASYQRLRELDPEHHEALWGRQAYYRAYSTVNGGRRVETDLFEGLRG